MLSLSGALIQFKHSLISGFGMYTRGGVGAEMSDYRNLSCL